MKHPADKTRIDPDWIVGAALCFIALFVILPAVLHHYWPALGCVQ